MVGGGLNPIIPYLVSMSIVTNTHTPEIFYLFLRDVYKMLEHISFDDFTD